MKKTLSALIATLSLVGFLQSCASVEENKTGKENQPQTTENVQETAKSEPVDPLAQFDKERSQLLTDNAKLLAGMKVEDGSKLIGLQKTDVWQNHHNTLENSWGKLEKQQLSKVREWSTQELKTINGHSPTVFYPFSGPDFLYGHLLFPQAKEMVMVGLEPVGSVPDLSQLATGQKYQKLAEARNSLYAILQFSFFRTNDMKVDLSKQGVTPILMLFMARTNNQILDIEFVGIDKDANVQKMADGMIPGVKFSYLPEGETTPRTLYYFSTDLSNDGLKKTPQFVEFVKKIEHPATYLKAASYLMYNDSFSTIRDLILTQSMHVLQDDSGMPVKYFDKEKWALNFYGTYTAPIALFSNRYQPDLRKIYQTDKEIKPLNFGIGYKFGVNESNLMLANKK